MSRSSIIFNILFIIFIIILCGAAIAMTPMYMSLPFTIGGVFVALMPRMRNYKRDRNDGDDGEIDRNSPRPTQGYDFQRTSEARSPQPTAPNFEQVQTTSLSAHNYNNASAEPRNAPQDYSSDPPNHTPQYGIHNKTYDAANDLPPSYESVVIGIDEDSYKKDSSPV